MLSGARAWLTNSSISKKKTTTFEPDHSALSHAAVAILFPPGLQRPCALRRLPPRTDGSPPGKPQKKKGEGVRTALPDDYALG